MARIAGVNLPLNKQVWVSLTYIFGIGKITSNKILSELSIDPNRKTKDLTASEVDALKNIIEKRYKVEGELRHEIGLNIRRLKEISCYRGIRHIKHLPARGQRTKTNSRTVRGNVRKTMGSGRKPPPQAT